MTETVKRRLFCPWCGKLHLDSRWWAHRNHTEHHCLFKACKQKFTTRYPCVGARVNGWIKTYKVAA